MDIYQENRNRLMVLELYEQGLRPATITRITGFNNQFILSVIKDSSPVLDKPKSKRGRPPTDEVVDNQIIAMYRRNHFVNNTRKYSKEEMYQKLVDMFPDKNLKLTGFFRKLQRISRQTIVKSPKDKPVLFLEHYPGEMQVDFGFCDFIEKGKKFRGAFLVTAFAYSNAVYVQVSKRKRTQDLIRGLINIFKYIGFVPKVLVFDNDPALVNLRTPNPETPYRTYREVLPPIKRFRDYFGFEARFCKPRSPQQKGVVERMVAFARKRMFVPIPEFDDVEEFNKELFKMCDIILNDMNHYRKRKPKLQLLDKERQECKPLPADEFEI